MQEMNTQEAKHQEKLSEWQAKVAECRSSGLQVRAWCAAHHISTTTYYGWEREVRNAAEQEQAAAAVKTPPEFVEVPAAAQEYGKVIVVEYEKFHLEIPEFIHEKALRRILSALKSC